MRYAPPTHHAARARHALLPHWLLQLGAVGVFGVSLIDSSIIPLPLPGSTDLLLLLLTAHRGNPFLLAAAAIAGSLVGAYLTWGAGKKGGEPMLDRYVPKRFLKGLTGFVKHHGTGAVVIASLLPPPIPLMPFLVSAAALGVPRNRFMLAFGAGRVARYSFIAWLGVTYGRVVVRAWARYLQGWSTTIVWAFVILLVAAIAFGIWKYRHDARRYSGGGEQLGAAAVEAKRA